MSYEHEEGLSQERREENNEQGMQGRESMQGEQGMQSRESMQGQESMQGEHSEHARQDQQSGGSDSHMNPERADAERFGDEPSQEGEREQVSASGGVEEEDSDLGSRPHE